MRERLSVGAVSFTGKLSINFKNHLSKMPDLTETAHDQLESHISTQAIQSKK